MSFDNIDQRFKPKTATSLACLRCYSTDGVEMESSRTQYHFEGDQNSSDNPNAPVPPLSCLRKRPSRILG